MTDRTIEVTPGGPVTPEGYLDERARVAQNEADSLEYLGNLVLLEAPVGVFYADAYAANKDQRTPITAAELEIAERVGLRYKADGFGLSEERIPEEVDEIIEETVRDHSSNLTTAPSNQPNDGLTLTALEDRERVFAGIREAATTALLEQLAWERAN